MHLHTQPSSCVEQPDHCCTKCLLSLLPARMLSSSEHGTASNSIKDLLVHCLRDACSTKLLLLVQLLSYQEKRCVSVKRSRHCCRVENNNEELVQQRRCRPHTKSAYCTCSTTTSVRRANRHCCRLLQLCTMLCSSSYMNTL